MVKYHQAVAANDTGIGVGVKFKESLRDYGQVRV
jgi:hypothetical protein